MTNRIINTDALKTLIKSINLKSAEAFDEDENKYDKFIPTNWLIETINQLSVSAPEPQESIFDADGWCYQIELAPVGEIHCALRSREIHVFYKEKCGKIYKGGSLNPYKRLKNIIAWRLPSDVKFPKKDDKS